MRCCTATYLYLTSYEKLRLGCVMLGRDLFGKGFTDRSRQLDAEGFSRWRPESMKMRCCTVTYRYLTSYQQLRLGCVMLGRDLFDKHFTDRSRQLDAEVFSRWRPQSMKMRCCTVTHRYLTSYEKLRLGCVMLGRDLFNKHCTDRSRQLDAEGISRWRL